MPSEQTKIVYTFEELPDAELSNIHVSFAESVDAHPMSPAYLSRNRNTRETVGNVQSLLNGENSNAKVFLMCNWLHEQQLRRMWSDGGDQEGVIIKKDKGNFLWCPPTLANVSGGFIDGIKSLNVKCAMTVSTGIIKLMLEHHESISMPLSKGLQLQVLRTFDELAYCQKHHFAAFIKTPPMLVVWDDDAGHLLERVQDMERQLMAVIWDQQRELLPDSDNATSPALYNDDELISEEAGISEARRTVLWQPFIAAVTLILLCIAIGGGVQRVLIETSIDKSWLRLAFVAIIPIQVWLGLFFFQSIVTAACQMIGPINQMRQNTRFYSSRGPRRLKNNLPCLTIQCPVYKEGLWTVIDPTIKSIKAAISTYEMQGGIASIFINDDGMQLIPESQAQERQEYYEEHNIGWVARPKHNSKAADGEKAFVRAGKFKKASNMNYALNVSTRVEDKLLLLDRPQSWTAEREQQAYNIALAEVINEDEGRTWAAGNIRIGDYILLIDSDTRVPVDCFLDAVSEMEASPQVAIIQYSSGVMNVTNSWFEKGITFFTNLVYTSIEFAVANGDVSPFVGHNAVLRWSAVQDVAYVDEGSPSYQKYWSESTVSEDFDMALRLQTSGYAMRLATYANGGFKEGVSLTVYDELARWEKYAYGCSELVFHPFVQWPYKGPFTSLILRFLRSDMPLPSKISIMAYVGTYFAIGSAWALTLLNYFVVGWYNGYYDHYYQDSFKIWFSIILIFNVVGNVALAVLRYRMDRQKLLPALLENFKWVPLLTIFLGGISLHVSQAILSHLFSIDMSWGATNKEATDTSFFREVPIIMRKFKVTFLFCLLLSTAMVTLAGIGPIGKLIPYNWQVHEFIAIFPLSTLILSHALLPLVLNPGLMQFTF